MRKYIIGILIGFCLSFGFGAHADVINMIGKTIDGAFAVKLDGKELENQAIVVEGTSYLPVRAIGEATGYDVKFDADLGISLTRTVSDVTYADQPSETPVKPALTLEQKTKKLENIEADIKRLTGDISQKQKMIDNVSETDPMLKDMVDTYKVIIQKNQEMIDKLEIQKAELNK